MTANNNNSIMRLFLCNLGICGWLAGKLRVASHRRIALHETHETKPAESQVSESTINCCDMAPGRICIGGDDSKARRNVGVSKAESPR